MTNTTNAQRALSAEELDAYERVREEFELATKLGARFCVPSAMLNVDDLIAQARSAQQPAQLSAARQGQVAPHAPAALSKAFMTLESHGGEGRDIVLKFNQRKDAYAVHDFLLKAGSQDYRGAAPAAPHAQAEPVAIELSGCLESRLYEAISIARDRAQHAGSTQRMKKWADTADDLRAVLMARAPAQEAEQAAPAAVTDGLREAVRAITLLIQNREWADVLNMDVDAIALWDAVNGMVEENNSQPAAPAVTDAARDVLADAKGGA